MGCSRHIAVVAACGPAPTAHVGDPCHAPTSTTRRRECERVRDAVHVATPGEIRYEVTGVSALASLAYSSTDGEIEFGGFTEPAAIGGRGAAQYGRRGAFTANTEATTLLGTNAAGERRP